MSDQTILTLATTLTGMVCTIATTAAAVLIAYFKLKAGQKETQEAIQEHSNKTRSDLYAIKAAVTDKGPGDKIL